MPEQHRPEQDTPRQHTPEQHRLGQRGTEPAVAATVVLLRDGERGPEVLLLERPSDRGSFAGAWVFPGGRVDAEDWPAPEPRATSAPSDRARTPGGPEEESAARRAAVREVREETSLEVPASSLVTTARWTPPENAPVRFRTWFFTARAPEGRVVLTAEESVDHAWMTPAAALDSHASGALSLVPPTWVTLHGLRAARTVDEVLRGAAANGRLDYATRLGTVATGPALFWEGDVAYTDDALAGADGGRHRLEIGALPWVYSRRGDV